MADIDQRTSSAVPTALAAAGTYPEPANLA